MNLKLTYNIFLEWTAQMIKKMYQSISKYVVHLMSSKILVDIDATVYNLPGK